MGVLRRRDFRLLWAGQSVSQLGSQISLVALPLLAIQELDADAFAVSVLVTAQFLPFLVFGLPAGAWIDRVSRRPVLIVSDVARAAVLSSVPLAFALGMLTLSQLYLVAFAHGVLTVFFDVAYQSYLPELIDPEELPDGNSRLELSRSGAQIVGPGLGGWLVSVFRAPAVLLVDAASFLVSAFAVWRIPERAASRHRQRPGLRGLGAEIGEGLRFVLRNRVLAPIAACTAVLNLFFGVILALLVVFGVRELGLTSGEIGLAMGLGNVGFFLGALFAGRISRRIGVGPSIVVGALLAGLGPILVAMSPRANPMPVLVAGLFVEWFGVVTYNVNQVSLRQAITPPSLLGRMNATMRFVVWGTLPVGSFGAGLVATALGLRPAMWVAAIGGTAGFVVIAFSAAARVRTLRPDELAGYATTVTGHKR